MPAWDPPMWVRGAMPSSGSNLAASALVLMGVAGSGTGRMEPKTVLREVVAGWPG